MPYIVVTRVRPCINAECGKRTTIQLPSAKSNRLRLVREDERAGYMEWEFDHVLGVQASQEDTYAKVRSMVIGVESNACILAYGQTGSGKTYSMFGGSGVDKAIVSRALDDIFANNGNCVVPHSKVLLSFLELYKDDVHDLLSTQREEKLDIRELGSGNVTVPGVTLVEVANVDQALKILSIGLSHRHCGDNGINVDSSRSHAIFAIDLIGELGTRRINFVDLAGSEKIANKPLNYVQQSLFPDKNNRSSSLVELTSINKSLSCLGHCIAAMVDKSRTHIPYRDSKLTRLLKDSLSGSSFCAMIVCVSPAVSCFDETFCTLKFADRARKAIVPADPDIQREHFSVARLYQLEAQISQLTSDLALEREERKRLQRHLNEALCFPATALSAASPGNINNTSRISDAPIRDDSNTANPVDRHLSHYAPPARVLSQSTLSMSSDREAGLVNLSADRLEFVQNSPLVPDSQYVKQSIDAHGTNILEKEPSTTRCSQNSEHNASDDMEESFASSEVVRDDDVEELLQASQEIVGAHLALKLEVESQIFNLGIDGRARSIGRRRVDKDGRELKLEGIASLSSLEELVVKQAEFHQLIKRYVGRTHSSPLSRYRLHKQCRTSSSDDVLVSHQKLSKRTLSSTSKDSNDERYSRGESAELEIVPPKDFASLVKMVVRIDRNVRSSIIRKSNADAAEESIDFSDSVVETTGGADTADEGHALGVANEDDGEMAPVPHKFKMMAKEKNYPADATIALIRQTQKHEDIS
eukprot:GEMP01014610.1.p1 GENE.GEMP01014610.1~~GEMP01014610.1.p1  ORF type:complete len:757 (+),score=191.55 GEMP01014610.1:432-2702(+)